MSAICPGRCNNRYRRALDAYETAVADWQAAEQAAAAALFLWRQDGAGGPCPIQEHGPRPAPPDLRAALGAPLWCGRCAAAIRVSLAELDEVVPLRLHQADGYGTPADYSAARVHRSRDAPPSPSPGHDDLDEVLDWLRDWEAAYRESLGWPSPPPRGTSAHALTATTVWLLAHLDRILAHPEIGEPFGAGVQWWHARLQSATSTRPPLRRKPVPCRRCDRYSLYHHDDAARPTVRCHADADACGLIMTVAEYDAYQAEYEASRRREGGAGRADVASAG